MATIQNSNTSDSLNGTLPKVRNSSSQATPEQLTHYHSFFTSLLSWRDPRASGIAYASIVVFILAARYLDILRYAFKLTWMTLGVTVVAEIIGQSFLGQGLSSQFRPRRYYTIPKETLDAVVGDVHELINFFVIESQRIVFAENVFVSGAAFLSAFISYYLVKVVPYWGLALIGTTVLFFAPLIYTTNQELIDHHLHQASKTLNQHTENVKQVAAHHVARATDVTKSAVGEYSAKAQEMIARGRSVSPIAVSKAPATKNEAAVPSVHVSAPETNGATAKVQEEIAGPKVASSGAPVIPPIKSEDFPLAPTTDFKNITTSELSENPSKVEEEPPITL